MKRAFDIQALSSRDGRPLRKRDIKLIDASLNEVNFTLWNEKCDLLTNEMLNHFPILAVKGARVGEFNGHKTLSTISGINTFSSLIVST